MNFQRAIFFVELENVEADIPGTYALSYSADYGANWEVTSSSLDVCKINCFEYKWPCIIIFLVADFQLTVGEHFLDISP